MRWPCPIRRQQLQHRWPHLCLGRVPQAVPQSHQVECLPCFLRSWCFHSRPSARLLVVLAPHRTHATLQHQRGSKGNEAQHEQQHP